MGIHPPESFGRIHHLPKQRLAAVMAGLRDRGLVDADGRFTDAGRETKQRIEALTDELAAPPYDALSARRAGRAGRRARTHHRDGGGRRVAVTTSEGVALWGMTNGPRRLLGALRDLPVAIGGSAKGARADRVRRSPQFAGDRFHNAAHTSSVPADMRQVLRDLLFGKQVRKPVGAVPLVGPAPATGEGLHVTWYGHASTLVELAGVRVLFDPVWSERVSPTQWLGPSGCTGRRTAIEDLPPAGRHRDLARPLRPPRPGRPSARCCAPRTRRSWCRWASARTWTGGGCPRRGSSSWTGTTRSNSAG